jgi:ubiquinone/menaquinone biosynthesis C-methylase UbiE
MPLWDDNNYSSSMPDRLAIYRNDPRTYDLLISREDYEGNIPKILERVCSFSDADVADIGAGTGRLAVFLAPKVRSLVLTDNAGPMLEVGVEKLRKWDSQMCRRMCAI